MAFFLLTFIVFFSDIKQDLSFCCFYDDIDDIDNEDDVVCVDYTTVIVISSVVGAVALAAFILIFQFIRYDSILSHVLYIFTARPLYTGLAYCCIFV